MGDDLRKLHSLILQHIKTRCGCNKNMKRKWHLNTILRHILAMLTEDLFGGCQKHSVINTHCSAQEPFPHVPRDPKFALGKRIQNFLWETTFCHSPVMWFSWNWLQPQLQENPDCLKITYPIPVAILINSRMVHKPVRAKETCFVFLWNWYCEDMKPQSKPVKLRPRWSKPKDRSQ